MKVTVVFALIFHLFLNFQVIENGSVSRPNYFLMDSSETSQKLLYFTKTKGLNNVEMLSSSISKIIVIKVYYLNMAKYFLYHTRKPVQETYFYLLNLSTRFKICRFVKNKLCFRSLWWLKRYLSCSIERAILNNSKQFAMSKTTTF